MDLNIGLGRTENCYSEMMVDSTMMGKPLKGFHEVNLSRYLYLLILLVYSSLR